MERITLPPADRLAIEDLMTDLSLAVDERDPAALGALMDADVGFDVGHGLMRGRDTVVAAFSGRGKDTSYAARHLWSNLKVIGTEGGRVHLRCSFATFAMTDLDGARDRVWRCGDYRDIVRKADDGRWLLVERRLILAVPD